MKDEHWPTVIHQLKAVDSELRITLPCEINNAFVAMAEKRNETPFMAITKMIIKYSFQEAEDEF